jgi:hypothetical protein
MTPMERHFERAFIESRRINWILWGLGFIATIAGGYLAAGYGGGVFGAGLAFLACAASNELKVQIYPIGIWALEQLAASKPDAT